MANLPLTDPTLAKQVWESMPNASTRRVARKLRQAGASISHMTVARWRNQGWRPLDGEQQHPLEVALAQRNAYASASRCQSDARPAGLGWHDQPKYSPGRAENPPKWPSRLP